MQVKDKLTPQTISETLKNRLLNQIVRDYFFKARPLALEYKSESYAQPQWVVSMIHFLLCYEDKNVTLSSSKF